MRGHDTVLGDFDDDGEALHFILGIFGLQQLTAFFNTRYKKTWLSFLFHCICIISCVLVWDDFDFMMEMGGHDELHQLQTRDEVSLGMISFMDVFYV